MGLNLSFKSYEVSIPTKKIRFVSVGHELGKVVNEYNGIANVFQSFYAIDSEGEEGKGITSYQLVKFDDRWWISDVLWTTDSNGVEIPEEYIKD